MSVQQTAVRYVAGGTVQAGDGVYVTRVADQFLYNYCRQGEFAYVLTSRQMGKSSLMIHVAERLVEEGVLPVILDLTELGVDTITAEKWYRGLAEQIAQQAELSANLGLWWLDHEHLGTAQRFTTFIEDLLLKERNERIVLFVDEIDSTLRLDFTDDFFASIRYVYNARATNRDLHRVSFVLLGVASPGDLIKDRDRTPFNIGKRVELDDFTEENVVRSLDADVQQVREIFRYTGGHPYLTLRVFRSLADKSLETTIERRIESLFFGEQSRRDSNLQFVRDCLLPPKPDVKEGESEADFQKRYDQHKRICPRYEKIRQRYTEVLKGRKVPDKESDPYCVALHLAGIVRSENGFLKVRNQIYGRVFDQAWIKQNQAINWAKRATWGAIVVAALLIVMLVLSYGNAVFKLAALETNLRAKVAEEQRKVDETQQTLQRTKEESEAFEKQREIEEVKLRIDNQKIGEVKNLAAELRKQVDALAVQKLPPDAQAKLLGIREKLQELDELNAPSASLVTPFPAVATPRGVAANESGTLIIYTTGSLFASPKKPRTQRPEVYLDIPPKPNVGNEIGYSFAEPKTFLKITVLAGRPHSVCVGAPNDWTNCTRLFNVLSNQTVYVKIEPDATRLKYIATLDGAFADDQRAKADQETPLYDYMDQKVAGKALK